MSRPALVIDGDGEERLVSTEKNALGNTEQIKCWGECLVQISKDEFLLRLLSHRSDSKMVIMVLD